MAHEVCFDGIVGPTHNYSGLSLGNVASMSHRAATSNPLEAVLQGLAKMKQLADLGIRQAVLPPQERPEMGVLRRLGYEGTDEAILAKVAAESPDLLSAVCSSSSMWTANAATVSPSADAGDGKCHFTPANLVSKFHRSIEAPTTAMLLKRIFVDPLRFAHHPALPGTPAYGDEGAANHTRLCGEYGDKGVELFVYGRHGLRSSGVEPKRYPARQTYEASLSIARLHKLDAAATVFAQQNPDAIDAGVFHNDVVGVGNRGVYFFHEKSWVDTARVKAELRQKFASLAVGGGELKLIEVPEASVSLEDAVKSYLFNSQLLSLPGGGMALALPEECKSNPAVAKYLAELAATESGLIRQLIYFDLKQSMQNGGGPACLRLRVVLTDKEIAAAHSRVFFDDRLFGELSSWARKHYRDRLHVEDLKDPQLLHESRAALDELTVVLGLGSIYSFQK